MSKAKMQAAKELIQAKKYDEARAILKTVDHPTAQQWLVKLDQIAPQAKSKKRRRIHPLIGIPLAIVGGLLLVIVIATVLGGIQRQNRYREQLPEALAVLSLFCNLSTNVPEHRCTEWINETFESDMSHVDDVLYCDSFYDAIVDPRGFADCLARNRIYLP